MFVQCLAYSDCSNAGKGGFYQTRPQRPEMDEAVLKRIGRQTGVDDLAERLARNLNSADLQSLWLEVTRRRAAALKPAQILRTYQESRFVAPAAFAQDRFVGLELELLRRLPPGVPALQLSPLSPLGTCSGLATVHQHKVVGTNRGHEVCADPTNGLALEAALRRRQGQSRVDLATAQRVVRAQSLPPGPGYYAHFGLFALTSAARWSEEFARHCLQQHWGYLATTLGDLFPHHAVSVRWTDLSVNGSLGKLAAQVGQDLPCEVVPHPQRSTGRGYYVSLCYKVWLGDQEVGDGGFTDWTQQLLGSRRESYFITGLGLDRLVGFTDC
jgi:hypothetical protein